MKVIIVTTTKNIKYGSGMNRVIFNAKEELEKSFNKVVIISAKTKFDRIIGLIKIIKENPFKFDYIIYNSGAYINVYKCIARLFGYKKAIYHHEMPTLYDQKKYENIKNKNGFIKDIKPNEFIHLCCSEANSKVSYLYEKEPTIEVIHNCIKYKIINNDLLFKHFTVVTVGRVEHIKGVDIWTEVAIKVCKLKPEIRFVWCGNISNMELYKKCLNKVANENLQENISFIDELDDANLLINASYLYYSSSRVDSFPLTVLEAMSYGKNIIYYNSGGIKEQVLDNGIFIENFSIEETANKIIELYNQYLNNNNIIINRKLQLRLIENYLPMEFVRKFKNALQKHL